MRLATLWALCWGAYTVTLSEANTYECSSLTLSRDLANGKCALGDAPSDKLGVGCVATAASRDEAWHKCDDAHVANLGDAKVSNNATAAAGSMPPAWMCATSGDAVKKRAEVCSVPLSAVHAALTSPPLAHLAHPCLTQLHVQYKVQYVWWKYASPVSTQKLRVPDKAADLCGYDKNAVRPDWTQGAMACGGPRAKVAVPAAQIEGWRKTYGKSFDTYIPSSGPCPFPRAGN